MVLLMPTVVIVQISVRHAADLVKERKVALSCYHARTKKLAISAYSGGS
jgi:hypothetical protein